MTLVARLAGAVSAVPDMPVPELTGELHLGEPRRWVMPVGAERDTLSSGWPRAVATRARTAQALPDRWATGEPEREPRGDVMTFGDP